MCIYIMVSDAVIAVVGYHMMQLWYIVMVAAGCGGIMYIVILHNSRVIY